MSEPRPGGAPDTPVVEVTRGCQFSAAHRLHSARFSASENARIYGRCNNMNGHGHTYRLEVTIRGRIEDETPPAVVLDFSTRTPAEVVALIRRLQDGEPSVRVNPAEWRRARILLNPACLRPGEAAIVVARIGAECGRSDPSHQ